MLTADAIYGPLFTTPPPGAVPAPAAAAAAADAPAAAAAPARVAADGARERRAVMLLVGALAVAILLTQLTVRGELEVSA